MNQITDFTYLKRYWQHLKAHKMLLFLGLLLIPCISLCNLLQPFLLQQGIDKGIIAKNQAVLIPILAAYGLCVLFEFLSRSLQMFLFQYIGQHSVLSIRDALFKHFLNLPLSYFDKTPQGQMNARITTDVEALNESFSSGVVTLLADILTLIGIAIAMTLLNWKLSILVLITMPFVMLYINVFRKRLRYYYNFIRKTLGQLTGQLQEQLEGVAIIQQFNSFKQHQKDFNISNNNYKLGTIRSVYYDAFLYSTIEAAGSILIAFVLYKSIPFLQDSSLSIGVLVAFIAYIQRFFEPLKELSNKFAVLQHTLAALEKIFSVYDVKLSPHLGKTPFREPLRAIEIKHLNFAYPNKADQQVLNDLSFNIKAGKSLAIVGPTGCGKSTIARLLLQLYEVPKETVLLNNKCISTYQLDDVRANISYVNQDIALFFGHSLHFNLSLGNPNISDEAIKHACQIACIDQKILSLPERYNTIITETENYFSTGEIQLIALARAIASDAPFIILDEATASIDSLTEQKIQHSLKYLFKNKTVMVIAHRLSTIKEASQIIVLNKGQVLESGTHQDLINKKGMYYHFYSLQQSE